MPTYYFLATIFACISFTLGFDSGNSSYESLQRELVRIFNHPKIHQKPIHGMHYLFEKENKAFGVGSKGYDSTNDEIPTSYSILLNFGLKGESAFYRTENSKDIESYRKKCPDNHMWDPFTKICRQLYCGKGYVLSNNHCIPNFVEPSPTEENPGFEKYLISMNVRYLSFNFSLNYNEELSYDNENVSILVADSISTTFHINRSRVDVIYVKRMDINDNIDEFGNETTVKYAHFATKLRISDVLTPGSKEQSSESVASSLAWTVSKDAMNIQIGSYTGRVFNFKDRVLFNDSSIKDWCIWGKRLEYLNQDFTVIDNNTSGIHSNTKLVYIKKTDKYYGPGYFLLSLLYRGVDNLGQMNQASGAALVCDGLPKIRAGCVRMQLNDGEYEMAKNGTIKYNGDLSVGTVLDLTKVEITPTNKVFVCCIQPKNTNKRTNNELNFIALVKGRLSTILVSISVVALILTLITYLLFEELRNLPGCNTLNLTMSIVTYQISFLLGQSHPFRCICQILSMVMHFSILSSFGWMNVMAYDLFRTFGHKHIVSHVRSKKKHLPWYVAYAYGIPFSLVTVGFMTEKLSVLSSINPNYGFNGVCWITKRTAAFILFATPMALVTLSNVIFLTITIRSMIVVRRKVKSELKNIRGLSYWLLYVKTSSVVGFTWIFAFFAAFVVEPKTLNDIFIYCFIAFNTLQGLYIFFVFILNKRVMNLAKNKLKVVLDKLNYQLIIRSPSTYTWRLHQRRKQISRVQSTDAILYSP